MNTHETELGGGRPSLTQHKWSQTVDFRGVIYAPTTVLLTCLLIYLEPGGTEVTDNPLSPLSFTSEVSYSTTRQPGSSVSCKRERSSGILRPSSSRSL